MMIKKYLFILFVTFLLTGGCSSKEDKTATEQSVKEHILKDQARALEKAKDVRREADKHYRDIEEQNK